MALPSPTSCCKCFQAPSDEQGPGIVAGRFSPLTHSWGMQRLGAGLGVGCAGPCWPLSHPPSPGDARLARVTSRKPQGKCLSCPRPPGSSATAMPEPLVSSQQAVLSTDRWGLSPQSLSPVLEAEGLKPKCRQGSFLPGYPRPEDATFSLHRVTDRMRSAVSTSRPIIRMLILWVGGYPV